MAAQTKLELGQDFFLAWPSWRLCVPARAKKKKKINKIGRNTPRKVSPINLPTKPVPPPSRLSITPPPPSGIDAALIVFFWDFFLFVDTIFSIFFDRRKEKSRHASQWTQSNSIFKEIPAAEGDP